MMVTREDQIRISNQGPDKNRLGESVHVFRLGQEDDPTVCFLPYFQKLARQSRGTLERLHQEGPSVG